jgi:hypothetical protein
MAQEVATDRGLLIGTAQVGVAASAAYGVFKRCYPGRSAGIHHVMAVDWQRDKWAMACQARDHNPGS